MAPDHQSSLCRSAHFTVLLALVLLGAAQALTVEAPDGECETLFMQSLFGCFSDFNVSFNTYLWAASNATGGTPPEDEVVFKEHMCGVEEPLVRCVLDSMNALVDTPACRQSLDMKQLLNGQIRTIFQQYDDYCAHECRHTLENKMRRCYSDLDLDPALFLSKNSDGAILGRTETSVSEFCNKLGGLMTCLRSEVASCPESPHVLQRLDLNLTTLASGLSLLCGRQQAYLSSLDCFAEQTRAVEQCHEEQGLTLKRLIHQAETHQEVTQEDFLNQFCLARLAFIKCEMESWAAKAEEACDSPTLALKRDVHCSQVPPACGQVLAKPLQQLCSFDWATVTSLGSSAPGHLGSLAAPLAWLVVVLHALCVVIAWM